MIRARFELKWQDAWVGAFWNGPRKVWTDDVEEAQRRLGLGGVFGTRVLDLWICLVPCLPLHITVGPDDVPMTPRWHCACGQQNHPAYMARCTYCGRQRPTEKS